MPALFVSTPGTHVRFTRERLQIELPTAPGDPQPPAVPPIHLSDIERVVISSSCHITLPAIAALLEHSIPLIITSASDSVLGLCLPPAPHSAARLAHYRAVSDPSFCLAIAALFIEAKIINSRRVLQRLAINRDPATVAHDLAALSAFSDECSRAASTDILRGYEGTAAARYFAAYATFFPEHAPFEHRSRRPPHNAPNAVLSYAYTLLGAETEAQLHAIGLDPALGFFHAPADRRPSLALDLIEPFRAPVVDAMTLDLFSHSTLHPTKHFERRNGGVFLNNDGKKRFFVAYERRMEREFTSAQHNSRTTLRNEIHTQALSLKQAILDGTPFLPFFMN